MIWLQMLLMPVIAYVLLDVCGLGRYHAQAKAADIPANKSSKKKRTFKPGSITEAADIPANKSSKKKRTFKPGSITGMYDVFTKVLILKPKFLKSLFRMLAWH